MAQIKAVAQAVDTLLKTGAWKATVFISDKQIVRASRKTFNRRFQKGNIELIVTIGRPNYAERDFIKDCKQAGEKFPVKKAWLKFLPKKK